MNFARSLGVLGSVSLLLAMACGSGSDNLFSAGGGARDAVGASSETGAGGNVAGGARSANGGSPQAHAGSGAFEDPGAGSGATDGSAGGASGGSASGGSASGGSASGGSASGGSASGGSATNASGGSATGGSNAAGSVSAPAGSAGARAGSPGSVAGSPGLGGSGGGDGSAAGSGGASAGSAGRGTTPVGLGCPASAPKDGNTCTITSADGCFYSGIACSCLASGVGVGPGPTGPGQSAGNRRWACYGTPELCPNDPPAEADACKQGAECPYPGAAFCACVGFGNAAHFACQSAQSTCPSRPTANASCTSVRTCSYGNVACFCDGSRWGCEGE